MANGVCHRCERVRLDDDAIWITVEKHSFYPARWEFCSIECLGSHFEVRPEAFADPREAGRDG